MKLLVTFKDGIKLVVGSINTCHDDGTIVLYKTHVNKSDSEDLLSMNKSGWNVERRMSKRTPGTYNVIIEVNEQNIDKVESMN